MKKKYWMTGLLALLLVFSAGCGQKPTAAPADPAPEQTVEANEPAPGDTAAEEPAVEEPTENEAEPVNAGAGDNGNDNTAEGNDPVPPAADTKVDKAVAHENKSSVKLYYTDPEMMELKEASREIKYTNDEDKYKKAFEELQKTSDPELNPLWSDKITLNSIKFDQGALTLDITKPAEANLGSGGEMFAIDALKKTFFQFDEVKSIELLVDGQQIESLMGHVELEHPMTRN